MSPSKIIHFFFFFNDTATTEIYTLSLHDALPIYVTVRLTQEHCGDARDSRRIAGRPLEPERSEEHTSELQSLTNLVCRLLLEKKKYYEKLRQLTQKSDAFRPLITYVLVTHRIRLP